MDLVIVDGYNVIHAWPELKAELTRGPLEAARRRLIALLAEYAAVRHVRVTVVFDGPRSATGPEVEVIDGVSVRFSGRSGSADNVIERIAYESARAGDMVTVATSDRLQRDMVRAIGGVTIDANSFELEVRSALLETTEGVTRLREVSRLAQRVEDVIPRDVAQQLDAIRRGVQPDEKTSAPVLTPPARPREQRKRDTLRRLEHDVDLWVATADEDGGVPHLVPLSFLWDGSTLLIATPASNPTGRNLKATGRVRLGVGATRDVVLIDATAEALTQGQISPQLGDAFAKKTGFDPRTLKTEYLYFRIRPERIQAWREVNELEGRDLMVGGAWVV